MEFKDIAEALFDNGGTIIMALLFIWVFVQDKTKNNKLLEDNTKMLQSLSKSNENIAKALDIISSNLGSLDTKIDRNYESIVKGGKQ